MEQLRAGVLDEKTNLTYPQQYPVQGFSGCNTTSSAKIMFFNKEYSLPKSSNTTKPSNTMR